MWFSSDPHAIGRHAAAERRARQGDHPPQPAGRQADRLSDVDLSAVTNEPTFSDGVGEESLTRFDKQGAKRRKGRDRKRSDRDNGGENARSGSRSEEGREARTAAAPATPRGVPAVKIRRPAGAGRPNSNRRGRGDNRPDRPQGSASREERPNTRNNGQPGGPQQRRQPGPPNRTDRPAAAKEQQRRSPWDGDAGPTAEPERQQH